MAGGPHTNTGGYGFYPPFPGKIVLYGISLYNTSASNFTARIRKNGNDIWQKSLSPSLRYARCDNFIWQDDVSINDQILVNTSDERVRGAALFAVFPDGVPVAYDNLFIAGPRDGLGALVGEEREQTTARGVTFPSETTKAKLKGCGSGLYYAGSSSYRMGFCTSSAVVYDVFGGTITFSNDGRVAGRPLDVEVNVTSGVQYFYTAHDGTTPINFGIGLLWGFYY